MPETEYRTVTAPEAVPPATDTSKWPVAPSATVPPSGTESVTLSVSDAASGAPSSAWAAPGEAAAGRRPKSAATVAIHAMPPGRIEVFASVRGQGRGTIWRTGSNESSVVMAQGGP